MNSSILSLISTAVLGLVVGIDPAIAEPPQQSLEIRVTPELRNGEPVLVFSVANRSAAPITVNESALPWGNRYSVMVVAVPKQKEPLRGVFPVDDVFVETPITLRPGESQTGEVPLAWHVQNAQLQLRSKDLILFWHYEPKSSKGQSLGEYGGWTTLEALRGEAG